MRARTVALAVVPLLLLPVACGNDKSSTSSAPDTLPGVTVTGSFGEAPTVSVKDLEVTKTQSATLLPSDGTPVSKDRESLVDMQIVSGVDGKVLYDTWKSGRPVQVGPSSQQLVQGFNDELEGKTSGSRVGFVTTVGDAVGASGAQQLGLKESDGLVVVADVLSVEDPSPLSAPAGDSVPPPANAPSVQTSGDDVTGIGFEGVGAKPTTLQVIPLVKGTGPAITAKSLVTFNYFGVVWKADKPFDESYTKDPATFPVGVGSLIPAWDSALIGVTKGSRVMIIAPPAQAYGAAGSPPKIPKNATLVFVIDVLGVDG